MAIIVPDQASLGMGRSEITPREVYAGMKDPGNKGAGLASLAKALGELGSTFADLGAKQKQQQEEAGMATAYYDAYAEKQPAGAAGRVGPGTTVKDRAPTLGDVNNWNAPTHSKVEITKRQIRGEQSTLTWLSTDGYLAPEKMPAAVRDDPAQFEAYIDAGRQKLIEEYRGDHVGGSAALKTYDNEADKLRTATGNERQKSFQEDEKNSIIRELNGTGDEYNMEDPAEVSPLEGERKTDLYQPSPATGGALVNEPLVPQLKTAIQQTVGNTHMGAYLSRLAQIESAGGRLLSTKLSSAKGPFQFIDSTAARYGLRNPMDFNQSVQAAAKLTEDNRRGLARSLGREPSFGELYLAHQQGLGGAIKILSNPNVKAVDLLGQKAVANNLPKAQKHLASKLSAAEFGSIWSKKFAGKKLDNESPQSIAQATAVKFPEYWSPKMKEAASGVDTRLQQVITRAQEISKVQFGVPTGDGETAWGGKRDEAQQAEYVKKGWSKTMKSDHLTGGAIDLVPLNEDGSLDFSDPKKFKAVSAAMKQAAEELGYDIEWGGDWKSFKDQPHYAIKGGEGKVATPDNHPILGNKRLQVASNDPEFAPQTEGSTWAEERYGPDEEADSRTTTTDYAVRPADERIVNDDGDEVLFVPSDPRVLGERRKLMQTDRERAKTSTYTNAERRDIYFDNYYNRAIAENDPLLLDVMPPEWLTPEQRAKTTKLREQMAVDTTQAKIRAEQLQAIEDKKKLDADKSSMIERASKGEVLDPKKEALKPDGTFDEDRLKFAQEMNNFDTVPANVSAGNAAMLEAQIMSSSTSGEGWKKLGFDSEPSQEELVRSIQANPGLTKADKADLLGRLDKLQEGAKIINNPDVSNQYDQTIGLTLKNIIAAFPIDPANPAQAMAFAPLQQNARQYFDTQLRLAVKAHMEDNDGALPRGSAMLAITNNALAATNTWLTTVGLPTAQNAVRNPVQYDATGAQQAPTYGLPTFPGAAPAAPAPVAPAAPAMTLPEGYMLQKDEQGRYAVVRKPN